MRVCLFFINSHFQKDKCYLTPILRNNLCQQRFVLKCCHSQRKKLGSLRRIILICHSQKETPSDEAASTGQVSFLNSLQRFILNFHSQDEKDLSQARSRHWAERGLLVARVARGRNSKYAATFEHLLQISSENV